LPIYDYRCDHCGHAFSAVQSYKDSSLEKCPNCGKKPRRLIVPSAIVFKGSGWYKTDSRKSSDEGRSAEKGDAKPETKSESKTETKPTSKPADKSSPKSEASS
jgi:putative FmdB family regulatory protein